MKIDLVSEGLLDRRQFAAWQKETRQAIRSTVVRAMKGSGSDIVGRVRSDMRSSFVSAKPKFLRSMRHKVYSSKPDQFPALHIGSKIPWLGIHEQGGTIAGRMLIPLLPQHQRIGPKAFRRVIADLMASGNAFFLQKDGKTILMAESIAENANALRRFKRAERLRTGASRIKRGQEIPIAVLMQRVTLKKRFDLKRSVQAELPRLAKAIQSALSRL